MKKVVLSFISASVLIGMIFSCQKEEVLKINENANNENVALKTSNAYNPYEYLGEIHNAVLYAALDESSYAGWSDTAQVIWLYEKINNELDLIDQDGLMVSNPINYLTRGQLNLLPTTSTDPEEYFDDALTNLTTPARTYLNDLKDLFDLHDEDEDLGDFDDLIRAMEQEVYEHSTLTSKEKFQILGSIAIGKYSFHFWLEGAGVGKEKRPKPWLCDTGGFLVGAGTTIWGWFNGAEWGNPITNGVAAGTFASAVAAIE